MQMTLFDTTVDDVLTDTFINDLKKGSRFIGSKERIKRLFEMNLPKSETENMLKDEYGIGGVSNGDYSQTHDAKGIKITLETNEEKLYSWSVVHDSILKLITNNEY